MVLTTGCCLLVKWPGYVGLESQWVQAYTAPAQDLSSVPSTHVVTHMTVALAPGDTVAASCCFMYQACTKYTHVGKTVLHIKVKPFFFFFNAMYLGPQQTA